MSLNKLYLVLLLFLSVPSSLLGQEDSTNFEEYLLEQLFVESEEDVDYSELIERLQYYRNQPLDLNKVEEKDLIELSFLNLQQINNILYHRSQTGKFISILELQAIPGLDFKTLQFLKMFVKVGDTALWDNFDFPEMLRKSDHALFLRWGKNLEKSAGYKIKEDSRSHYLGDPNRYAVRYRFNFENKIRIAINMEKDAGEAFFKEKQQNGFDYYSGSISFDKLNKNIKQVVLGDYALQFGQGLVIWNGLSFGKGAWIGSVSRSGVGLRPYTSMNENKFQRGIASTLQFGKVEITPFLAYNKLSGNIEEDEHGNRIISTINYSGLHRTQTELSYRKAVNQWNFGSHFSLYHKRLKLGLTYLNTIFEHAVSKGEALDQQYDFEGRSSQLIGLNYNYTYRNFYLFGEGAKSIQGGWAVNNGLIGSLNPKLSVVINYRNYQKDYRQFYGQSLSESSGVGNENGFYTGLVYHPNRRIEWSNFIDIFKFPYLKYRVDAPSSGTDFLSQFSYIWYKKGYLRLRYRERLRQENSLPIDRSENLLADVVRRQLRLEFQYKLNDKWSIKSRAELSKYDKEYEGPSRGMLLFQDVFWKGLKSIQSNLRFAYFNTQDYNSRIYAYESDVLYASGFPMYYDKGFRSYANIKWRLSKYMDLWVRYGITKYLDRETIGSGLEEIEGDVKSDVKVQIRYQW